MTPQIKRLIILLVATAVLLMVGVPMCKQAQRSRKAEAWQENEFGPLGKTIDEILSHEGSPSRQKIVGAIAYRIGRKAEYRGVRSLSETERRFYAVRELFAEVKSKGFSHYFSNSAGDNAESALAGLREAGATEAATLLERAMAVFPSGRPPSDRAKRQRIMETINTQSKPVWNAADDQFYRLKEPIGSLLLAYAKKKKAEFVFP